MRGLGRVGVALCVATLWLSSAAGPGWAATVKFLHQRTSEDFLSGTLNGVALDGSGTVRLGSELERAAQLEEPFVFSAVADGDGWIVGTGNSGRVLRVSRDGDVEVAFEAEEPQVFAVAVGPDGAVYAGTSPRGQVYRIDDDGAEPFFDPKETYIWCLAWTADGRLLVGTGTQGRLYTVGQDGASSVLHDGDDPHIRSVEALADGTIYAGTVGEGRILRIDADGDVTTVYDAVQPEVVDFAVGGDGAVYAALLQSEASLSGQAENADDEDDEDSGPTVEVTVGVSETSTNENGVRSEVVRIHADGRVASLLRLQDETVYSLGFRDRLWIATGLEGKVYSLRGKRKVLEHDLEASQVVSLVEGPESLGFVTANAAAVYAPSGESVAVGEYLSKPLDTRSASRFGTLRWTGEVPDGARVRLSARSGSSSEPDETWSAWSPPHEGSEIPMADLPPGRYVQWKAELEASNGAQPELYEVELSYRQQNLPPEVESLTVLDPGQVYVPSNFNPATQVYEPAHPNRQGIFTTLGPARDRDRRQKTLWRKGFRTLAWEAEDPNDDRLEAAISFQPVGESATWFPIASEVTDDWYSFDATSLPDGLYRFRLELSDRLDNNGDEAETGAKVSEPVVVDHSPSALESKRRTGPGIAVELSDTWSPLRGVEVSFDAGEWVPVVPEDGLLDGRRERLTIDVPEDAELILLRVSDAAFNVVTFDLSDS